MKHTNRFLLETVLNKIRNNKTDNISNYIRKYSEDLPKFLVYCIENKEFEVAHDLYHTFTSLEREKLSTELDKSFQIIKNLKINLLDKKQAELIGLLLDDLTVWRKQIEIKDICKNNTHYRFSDEAKFISLQQFIAKNSRYKDIYDEYKGNYEEYRKYSDQLADDLMLESGSLLFILAVGFFVSILGSSFTLLAVIVGGILFFGILFAIYHFVQGTFFGYRMEKILRDGLEKVHGDAEKKTYTKAELQPNKAKGAAEHTVEEKAKQADDTQSKGAEMNLQEKKDNREKSPGDNRNHFFGQDKSELSNSSQPLDDSTTQEKGIGTQENKAQRENDSSFYAGTAK